jgi:hypothetical protein
VNGKRNIKFLRPCRQNHSESTDYELNEASIWQPNNPWTIACSEKAFTLTDQNPSRPTGLSTTPWNSLVRCVRIAMLSFGYRPTGDRFRSVLQWWGRRNESLWCSSVARLRWKRRLASHSAYLHLAGDTAFAAPSASCHYHFQLFCRSEYQRMRTLSIEYG